MFSDLKIAAGRRPMTTGERWFSALAGSAFAAVILVDVFDEFTPQKLSVLFILLFWIPLLVLHELGHAGVAKLLGWKVREIVIGFGPTLWQGTIGHTTIKIRLAPVEGYVLPEPVNHRHIKLKTLLVYAAGPGAELALLVVLVLTLGWNTVFNHSAEVSLIALKSLAIAILIGAVTNLIPFRVGRGVSDGLGILMSPFMTSEIIELRLLAADRDKINQMIDRGEGAAAAHAAAALLNKYPDNAYLAMTYAEALSTAGRSEDARAYVRDQLSCLGVDDSQRIAWLIAQAHTEFDAQQPAFLVMDLALQEAGKAAPQSVELQAMQGASLVLKNQIEAGGAYLKDAWRRNDGEVDDAFILLYLTIAASRLGEHDAARHFHASFNLINKQAKLDKKLKTLLGEGNDRG